MDAWKEGNRDERRGKAEQRQEEGRAECMSKRKPTKKRVERGEGKGGLS